MRHARRVPLSRPPRNRERLRRGGACRCNRHLVAQTSPVHEHERSRSTLSGTAGTSLPESRRPPARAPWPGSPSRRGHWRIRTPSSVPRPRPVQAPPRRGGAGLWAKNRSTRRAASPGPRRVVAGPPGHLVVLAGHQRHVRRQARAAAHQAPTVWACTRLALVGDPHSGALQRCPASGHDLVVQEHVHDAPALTGEGRQATGTDTAALRRSDPWSASARSAA